MSRKSPENLPSGRSGSKGTKPPSKKDRRSSRDKMSLSGSKRTDTGRLKTNSSAAVRFGDTHSTNREASRDFNTALQTLMSKAKPKKTTVKKVKKVGGKK